MKLNTKQLFSSSLQLVLKHPLILILFLLSYLFIDILIKKTGIITPLNYSLQIITLAGLCSASGWNEMHQASSTIPAPSPPPY